MKIASFFSGAEASHHAINKAGLDWETISVSEIDLFACELLAHHFPNIPNRGDFTKVTPSDFYEAEMIAGGPPCQSYSIAGKRGGLDDERGDLTLKYMELCHDCADNGSLRLAFYENVPGILSDKTNAFGHLISGFVGGLDPVSPPDAVWGSDEDGAIGWQQCKWPSFGMASGPRARLAWRTLDAQWFGLAQRRRRVFIVVSFDKDLDPAKILFERKGLQGNTAPSRKPRENFTQDVGNGSENRFIGGGGDKQIAGTLCAKTGRAQSLQDASDYHIIPEVAHTLRGEGFDASEDGTGRGTPLVPMCMAHGQGGAEVAEDCSPTLTCNHEAPIAFSAKDNGRDASENICPTLRVGGEGNSGGADHKAVAFAQNTRDEVRMIGGDGDLAGALAAQTGAKQQTYIAEPYTIAQRGRKDGPSIEYRNDGTANALLTPNGGRAGMGVGAVATASKIRGGCEGGGKGYLGSDERAFTISTMQDQNIFTENYAVRRLTPEECEILQGFPAGWTKIPYRNKPAKDCPDGHRYKTMGNSWAVNCVAWIYGRIGEEIRRVG